MTALTYFSPAKLNLFLAITGRRSDGFHELVSVVAPLTFGDSLAVEAAPAGEFTLTCTDPEVPCDGANLILKAAQAFVAATHWHGGAAFRLEKKIPMGAGLGGGSSNAVAALRALNALAGEPIGDATMHDLAASLGSDCPLFLHGSAVIMRGRGERLERLPETAARRIRGRRVLVFKPGFAIPTSWSYRRLAEMAGAGTAASAAVSAGRASDQAPQPRQPAYLAATDAEERLAQWVADASAPAEALLFNTLEQPAFGKYLAIPALLDDLAGKFRLVPRMTGSGSACFAFLSEGASVDAIAGVIRAAWGNSAFIVEARVS